MSTVQAAPVLSSCPDEAAEKFIAAMGMAATSVSRRDDRRPCRAASVSPSAPSPPSRPIRRWCSPASTARARPPPPSQATASSPSTCLRPKTAALPKPSPAGRRRASPSTSPITDWQEGLHRRCRCLAMPPPFSNATLENAYDAGTHRIFIGRVVAASRGDAAAAGLLQPRLPAHRRPIEGDEP